MVDTVTKATSINAEENKKEKWTKSWRNLDILLNLLMRTHPITGTLVHSIFNALAKKELAEKTPLTDEDKCKSAFEVLALTKDPKIRAAIHNMSQDLQQRLTTAQSQNLQIRTQAVMKDLSSRVGELFTTPTTMLFNAQRNHATPLAALVPKATPESHALTASAEQARKIRLTHPA